MTHLLERKVRLVFRAKREWKERGSNSAKWNENWENIPFFFKEVKKGGIFFSEVEGGWRV